MLAMQVVFWASVLLIMYSYVIYPALIWCAARTLGSAPRPASPEHGDRLPLVSLLIAAYNEEDSIGGRLANACESDYPSDRLEILVGSDCSSDRTNEIVATYDDERVRLVDCRERGGKASVLNRLAPDARGEVLVFSDANTHYEPRAIRELVAPLVSQEGVAAVCGRLVLTDSKGGTNADGLYWRYETAIKRSEGRLGAVLGANGAIYALRKRHFVPLPDQTIVDDLVEPLLAKLQHGGSIVYQPEAVAHEETPPGIGDEFRRRSRIGAGNFQSLRHLWPLVLPWHGWTALAFFSHKILRWTTPLLMLSALLSNLALVGSIPYRWLFAAQLCFYAAAAVGARVRGGGVVGKFARLAAMFAGMNAALALGFWRWIIGGASGVWGRTARSDEQCAN